MRGQGLSSRPNTRGGCFAMAGESYARAWHRGGCTLHDRATRSPRFRRRPHCHRPWERGARSAWKGAHHEGARLEHLASASQRALPMGAG